MTAPMAIAGLLQRLHRPTSGDWLLAGTLITNVGNAMHALAVGKLLYDHTGSVAAFGFILLLEQVLNVVIQLVAGPVVDRGPPRQSCLWSEIGRGVIVAWASIMVAASTSAFWWIALMTMAIRLAQPFYRAAVFSLVPALMPAEQVVRYNGWSNVCQQGGQLAGVAIAGPVLVYLGAPAAMFINGLTFLLSAATVWMIALPPASATRDPASRHIDTGSAATGERGVLASISGLLDGWREIAQLVRSVPGLARHVVLGGVDTVSVALFNVLLMPIVIGFFAGSAYWLSIVDGAFAVGAIVAVVLIEPLAARLGTRGAVRVGILGQGGCFVLIAFCTDLSQTASQWVVPLLALGIGACNTISWTLVTSTLQLRTNHNARGRVATLRNLLTAVVAGLLLPIVSALEQSSLVAALLAAAGACGAYALLAGFGRRANVLGPQLPAGASHD